ncbi:MAG: WXG100 family type VII secretion target [Kineosporiaceae bacterium]
MAQLIGMDVEAVRQLSQQMTQSGQQIQQIVQQLTAALQQVQWIGPDRERFVSDWESQHVQALNQVVQSLEQASQLANQNAQEQETASA